MKKKITVMVSGGFDTIHIGHIKMFQEAKKLGDKLVVIVNSDRFLKEKKGYAFMTLRERMMIIRSIACVDKVIRCCDSDQTVCRTLTIHRPDIFANGGDRKKGNIPEYDICKRFGIKMVFNVGGNKKQSSSKLIRAVRKVKKIKK